MSAPSSPYIPEPCQAIIAVFVYGADRCLRDSVTYVQCEDMFCSAVHPACEQHSTDAKYRWPPKSAPYMTPTEEKP